MPVKAHSQILAKQFLLVSTKPDHPNNANIIAAPPLLEARKTLYSNEIKPLVPGGISD